MTRGRLRTAVAVTALGTLVGAGLAVAPATAPGASAVTVGDSCVDGGGTRWDAKVVWGDVYTNRAGQQKVAIKRVVWTTDREGPTATDALVRVADASRKLIQRRDASGTYDYVEGTVNVGLNPRDPLSLPGRARLALSLGIDGDGARGCTILFKQPRDTATAAPTASAAPSGTASTRPSSTPSRTASAAPSRTASPAPTTSTTTTTGLSQRESDILARTNAERTSRSVRALSSDTCLLRYARAQAQRQAAERRMFHQDLSPIPGACTLRRVGENVAYGYPSTSSLLQGWMNSSGHRANILNGSYTKIGVGAAQDSSGRWYYAQVFGG